VKYYINLQDIPKYELNEILKIRSMKIGVLKESNDNRVAFVPEVIAKMSKANTSFLVEKGAGNAAFFSDAAYAESGAKIYSRKEVIAASDLLISIFPPETSELPQLKNKILVSSFQPFNNTYSLSALADGNINAFSLDMIPRTTLAQSMDVLSSMASIAGYRAVLKAAELLPRYFPMLTTAAGSIPPAKILILGAGVAGLQAIATAKRLGGKVEAFDTRLAAKEEVMSLGAKFVEVEGAKDDKGAGGYAVDQTEEYKIKQKALIKEHIIKSDVVITTAQLRGKPAPKLITKDMVELMRPGSVIVDLASSTGGNCELTQDQKMIMHGDIKIFGNSELSGEMPMHASQMYSKNIANFLDVLLKEEGFKPDFNNEIVRGACVVYNGKVLYGNPAEVEALTSPA
jgi:NAD(P) transhydrogenase subunit alpha